MPNVDRKDLAILLKAARLGAGTFRLRARVCPNSDLAADFAGDADDADQAIRRVSHQLSLCGDCPPVSPAEAQGVWMALARWSPFGVAVGRRLDTLRDDVLPGNFADFEDVLSDMVDEVYAPR